MNPEIKQQWIAALRSGEYKQGKRVLHNVDENTYCCLGVLCDLAVKAGAVEVKSHEYNSSADGDITVYGADGDCNDKGGVILPDEVMTWAGIENSPIVYAVLVEGEEEEPKDLTELNDGYDWTFEQLADVIKQSL